MTLAAPTLHTPLDVARLSDQTGKLYELVGGQLVEKDRMSLLSNWIATRVAHLLTLQFPVEEALVIVEQPVYCFADSGHMRCPDVTLILASKVPGGLTDDELHAVPDLVVEVASPSNRYDDLLDRIEEFLQVGVPLAAIIDPRHRLIHLYRQDGSGKLYRPPDVIADEAALPGLRLIVADCFPPAPSSSAQVGQ